MLGSVVVVRIKKMAWAEPAKRMTHGWNTYLLQCTSLIHCSAQAYPRAAHRQHLQMHGWSGEFYIRNEDSRKHRCERQILSTRPCGTTTYSSLMPAALAIAMVELTSSRKKVSNSATLIGMGSMPSVLSR